MESLYNIYLTKNKLLGSFSHLLIIHDFWGVAIWRITIEIMVTILTLDLQDFLDLII